MKRPKTTLEGFLVLLKRVVSFLFLRRIDPKKVDDAKEKLYQTHEYMRVHNRNF